MSARNIEIEVMTVAQDLPKRKPLRLPEYDYRTTGAYFVTVCTKNKALLFDTEKAGAASARMIEETFLDTIARFPGVEAPVYVVMPNHFHAIVTIAQGVDSPSVSAVVQAFKSRSTVEYARLVKEGVVHPFEKQLWQRSFYEHVIRGQDDFLRAYEYICANPARWAEKNSEKG